MKIYAVIVTYNGMKWIDRCLQSLRSSTVHVIPIVIDNCSTDDTRNYVPQNYPEAIWMPQNDNLGFGRANNLGIRYAIDNGAEYVLLLNQDGSIKDDAIEQMLKASDGNSLIVPLQLNGDGTAFDYMFSVAIRAQNTVVLEDLLLNNNLQDGYEIGEISAACWFMPIKVINTIGGFNPCFYHYCEDNNYHHRLRYHNIKQILAPKAHMYHDRKIHGNMQMYKRNMQYRNMTLCVCNINNSSLKIAIQLLRMLKLCYIQDLRKGNYVPGLFMFNLAKLLVNCNKILKGRHIDKQKGPHWL